VEVVYDENDVFNLYKNRRPQPRKRAKGRALDMTIPSPIRCEQRVLTIQTLAGS
jgi:hypothetical protein